MLVFETPGIADLRALLTMGVHVKKTATPIGMFGTGFKYAIAVILRNNGRIAIKLGKDGTIKHFHIREEYVRNEPFQFIYLDDTPLHITTHIGKNWTLENAYRELYSNTHDEGGCVYKREKLSSAEEDKTYIFVKGLDDCHAKRHEQILLEQIPIYKDAHMEIYEGETSNFFYKGICVGSLTNKLFKYRYNILSGCSLTEDRTVSWYTYKYQLQVGIIWSTDSEIINNILEADRRYMEYELDYDYSTWSDEFERIAAKYAHSVGDRYNPSIMKRMKSKNPEAYFEFYEPTKFEQAKVNRALDFMKMMGHENPYIIKFVKSLGSNIMGATHFNDMIYISELTLKAGLKQIVATIFEEYFHNKYQLLDCSVEMQNKLFELLIEEAEQRLNFPL